MKIYPDFDQALPTVDNSPAANFPSRRVTVNLDENGQQDILPQQASHESNRPDIDNFLATIDIFDEDLLCQDDFFPAPEAIHSNTKVQVQQHETSNKAPSNKNFARSLSNDFFLKQLIGEDETDEFAATTGYDTTGVRCAPPSPVASSTAMPMLPMQASGYPPVPVVDTAQLQSMWQQQQYIQQQQPQQLQYLPPPPQFAGHPCNVPNTFPSQQGGYIHLNQQPIAEVMTCPLVTTTDHQQEDIQKAERPRRTCSYPNCTNRIVQGGRCIGHGAKRKTCRHPGCDKRVKQAGMCSAHGPARKRCEHEGCTKVAVQGGKCIAHGARKRLCCIDECTKQGILGGMCKKHYDSVHGVVKVRAPRKKARVSAPSQYGACCA